MANSNSITHSFASKAALSAATSLNRDRMQNIFTFKSFASFFSCLSWKEVALGHLHIYTATDPQKLIVNKLPTFCWGHIFISWGGKSWMLIFFSQLDSWIYFTSWKSDVSLMAGKRQMIDPSHHYTEPSILWTLKKPQKPLNNELYLLKKILFFLVSFHCIWENCGSNNAKFLQFRLFQIKKEEYLISYGRETCFSDKDASKKLVESRLWW